MGWLTGWGYRKSHVINPATGAGTNYQKRITVHYGAGADSGKDVYLNGKCKTDFGDIRVTQSDGTTIIAGNNNGWREEKVDSDHASIWIKIPDSLESNPVTIYVYYGNASATWSDSGDNTFPFFDDFNNGSIDPNKWSTMGTNPPQETGGNLVINPGGGAASSGAKGKTSFGLGYAMRQRYRFYLVGSQYGWAGQEVYPSASQGQFFFPDCQDNATNKLRARTYKVGGGAEFWDDITNDNNFHVYEGRRISSTSEKYVRDDSVTHEFTNSNNIPITDLPANYYTGGTGGATRIGYVDWVLFRKYVDPEPAHSTWGGEETPPVGGGGGSVIPVLLPLMMGD